MIADNIISNWNTAPTYHAAEIEGIDPLFPAWTLKFGSEYGVAVPLSDEKTVSEAFSGTRMYSADILLDSTTKRHALLLMTNSELMKTPFSVLCAEFITPGIDGIYRKELYEMPTLWWEQWKELLGNKNIDQRVYDVLGELCVFRELALRGKNVSWDGPSGASYDFQSAEEFFEVKSSVIRSRREITVSNPQQLIPPQGSLFLMFCQFEPAQTGLSINSLIDELETLGISRVTLNQNLERLGFEAGKSARNKLYILHSMISYAVDDSFPIISNDSFTEGHLPKGITKITYTVSLDGMDGEFWIGQV